MNRLETIPLDKIDVGDGFNPRSDVALDPEFLASIEVHGVLTPILVHPQGSGKSTRYFLVAGERRYQAAKKLGHTEIPAAIRTEFATGNALPAALAENMQRRQLSPIEEARAFEKAIHDGLTPTELATAIGISPTTVKSRLQLLTLPEKVKELVDVGDLTLRTADSLQALEPFGEKVVAKTAELMIAGQSESSWDEPIVPGDLDRNPEWVLDRVKSELGNDAPFLEQVRKGQAISLDGGYGSPDFGDVDTAAIKEKAARLPQYDANYKRVRGEALALTQEDLDAARAYGCLVELDETMFLTDPAWLVDLLDGKLDKAITSWERKQKRAAKKNGDGAGDPVADAREQKRQQNAGQRAAQISARERNISLRHALMQLHTAELTLDSARAIGELLLTYAGTDLGHLYRFVDERCETVKTKKSGEISSLTYTRDADVYLREALRSAETPERVLGVLLQALVAAAFVDTTAARPSDRYALVRGLGSYEYQRNNRLREAIEKIAEPLLPADIQLELKERREQATVERTQEARETREQLDEAKFKGIVCPACGWSPARDDEPCACTVDEIAAAMESCPRLRRGGLPCQLQRLRRRHRGRVRARRRGARGGGRGRVSLAGRPSIRGRDHRNGAVLIDNPRFPKKHGREIIPFIQESLLGSKPCVARLGRACWV